MKTLKKVLAMTLAFATAMTMFISASAFTDDADITQTEAVGALSSLGIIKGNTDGSFAPTKTVTRGEMAKMIYVLRTGKDDGAITYSSLSTTFTDIGSTWAAPYIKYCASLGIINGRSATKFDPDATVTGLEAGKMLLVCMGYDAERAGLTGATWGLNTAALGDENKLFVDVYQDLAVALNRENAAQEIYNTLDAKTVRYDGDDQAYTNQTIIGGDMETVGEKFLDLHTVTGMLDVSGNIGLAEAGDDDYLSITTVRGLNDTRDLDFTDVTEDHTDLLGQTVKVMYKTTTSTTGKKTTTVYGVYSSDENQEVITCKASDLDTTSDADKFKIDGKKYTMDETLTIYVEDATAAADDQKLDDKYTVGTIYTTSTDSSGNVTVTKTTSSTTLATAIEAINDSDFEVTAISNNDNSKIDTIIVRQKQFGKITTKNNTKVAYQAYANGAGGVIKSLDLESDTPEIYDGYAKDDYIFAGVNLFTGNTTITKADKISGKVTASKSDEAEISGTWYDTTNTGKPNLSVNKDTVLYVYGTYAYYTEGTAATDLDTLVVKSVGDYKTLDGGRETKVIFEDGTEKVINVVATSTVYDAEWDDATGATNAGMTAVSTSGTDTNLVPGLYTYVENDGDYTLFSIKANAGTIAKTDNLTAVFATTTDKNANAAYYSKTETINGKTIDDDAVIYLNYQSNGDKWKAMTGKDLSGYKTMTGNVTYVTDKDGVVVYAFIETSSVASDNTLYGVVTDSYTKYDSDGSKKVVYLDMLTADGEKKGVETDKTSLNATKGDIVEFSGDYTLAKDIVVLTNGGNASGNNKAQGYVAIDDYKTNTGLLTFKAPGTDTNVTNIWNVTQLAPAKIVADTTVIYIDQDGTWAVSSGSPSEAQAYVAEDTTNNYNGYYANAYVVTDTEEAECELVVIEVNGEMKDNKTDGKNSNPANTALTTDNQSIIYYTTTAKSTTSGN